MSIQPHSPTAAAGPNDIHMIGPWARGGNSKGKAYLTVRNGQALGQVCTYNSGHLLSDRKRLMFASGIADNRCECRENNAAPLR